MTILLKRNAETDVSFSVHGAYINEGDTVELVKVVNGSGYMNIIPATIKIKLPNGRIHPANLNCYDYVKQS